MRTLKVKSGGGNYRGQNLFCGKMVKFKLARDKKKAMVETSYWLSHGPWWHY
jgi:hypothetical protein